MKRLKKEATFFIIGGIGYGILEVLWRGYTHWAMVVAGGVCFVMFSHVAMHFQQCSLLLKATLCALCVTGVEAVFGVVFNLLLNENIWDYSHLPLNFMGQVCLLYSFLWGILAIVFLPLVEYLNRKLL